jgi:general secretion pathway protein G
MCFEREDRRQKSEVRSHKTEVRSQKIEVASQTLGLLSSSFIVPRSSFIVPRSSFIVRPSFLVRRRAFTLLEVLMVLVIMGMVAGLVTVNVHSRMMLAKQNMAKTEIASVVDALESFHLIYGKYPSNDEGLAILTQATAKCPEPLLHANLADPWGHPYEYTCPGQQGRAYEVVCLGADGVEGGSGADADIVSWDLKEKRSGP